jgi:glycosyltransferase involved in cell wall biosynthesis
MPPSLRKLGIAARLLFAGDIPELSRRVRVAVFGNSSIDFPEFPAVDSLPTLFGAPPAATSKGPVRCLMFAHNLNYEGAPVSQFELTRALMERGVIVPDVIAFDDGPLRAAYENIGIAVSVIPSCLDRIPTLSRLQRVVDELAALVEARRPEVVYANTLLTFVAVIAAYEAGIPSIWNVRESEPWETCFGFLRKSVARRALAAITLPYRVVFVADATRRIWSRFDVRKNFEVIRNGLDPRSLRPKACAKVREALRRKLGYKEGEIVFLCVGTICERKGQRDLVRAFASFQGALARNARVCLVGTEDSRYMRGLRSDIARLSPERRAHVAMHPATSDVQSFFIAADVYVLCSRLESYPRVILEAMAHNLPVLATPVFGVREQLTEGLNALFFEPGDIASLTDCMSRIVADGRLRERLARESENGFATLNGFEEMVTAYGTAFSRLGKRPGS